MSGTTIPDLEAADFASRMADLIPEGWCSEEAKQTGIMAALLTAIGAEAEALLGEIDYALSAARIATETDPELSLAAQDFFGPNGLPRPAGDTDAQYAQYIKDSLFRGAVTRDSIQTALNKALPVSPRLIEPWRMADTGYIGGTYLDHDTAAFPGRVAAPEWRYQGIIELSVSAANEVVAQTIVNTLRAFGTLVWLKSTIPAA